MRSLAEYHEGAEANDDAVIVCLDWTGTSVVSQV